MALPPGLGRRLKLPAIVAPMFLASGPDLVVETCKAGLIGSFPALNQRSTAGVLAWLDEIAARLMQDPDAAPFGINLIVHSSNTRLEADLAAVVAHKVPLVITSLGAVKDVVEAVHGYGGLVFHDVVSLRHAEKAIAAGVDGLIAVCAGAGGHAGTLSPFAFVPEIRRLFAGAIVLAGAISTGDQVAAIRLLGADLAYIGTRFLATHEALTLAGHKEMIVASSAADIVHTAAVSGIPASFLRQSLIAGGYDPDQSSAGHAMNLSGEAAAWKTVWSAGQGVGSVRRIMSTADVCAELVTSYEAATRQTAAILDWAAP